MAQKKPRKNQKRASSKPPSTKSGVPAPLAFLDNLLDTVPDEAKLDLLASLMGEMGISPAEIGPKPTSRAGKIEWLLGEALQQPTAGEALPLLEQASDLARRALGKRFEKLAGRLGDSDKGELYLEVQAELAQALRAAGQHEAALKTAAAALELDPDDPCGIRTSLLAACFELDRLDEVESVLNDYGDEPWAPWTYSQLLLALRRGQRGEDAVGLLREAHEEDPYILGLLLAPDVAERLYESADDDLAFAQDYIVDFLPAWRDTPGAMSWLRETTARLGLQLSDDEEAVPPKRLSARDYARLPTHEHATWIVGVQEMPRIELPGQERSNFWLVFSFSEGGDLIGFDMQEAPPKPKELWDSLTHFMLEGESNGRPEKMMVHPPELAKKLKKDADRARIQLEPCGPIDDLLTTLKKIAQSMQGASAAAEQLPPAAIEQTPLVIDEVFEAAVVQLDQRLNVENQSLRPWFAIVVSRTSGLRWTEVFMAAPPANALENAVRMAIARPTMGAPCRPREVAVRDHDEAQALARLASQAGFTVTVAPQLPLIQTAIDHLASEVIGPERCSVLTRIPGVSHADLERFYTAAADFYRARPWKRFAMDEIVVLEEPDAARPRWFALVMGQSGITQGLALYANLEDIQASFEGQMENTSVDSMSVMFGEEGSISPPDLDAIEQFGWPVATPEAYPDALRIHPGMRVETPSADELRFLSASLAGVAHLTRNPNEASATETVGGVTVCAKRLGSLEDA